MVAVYEETYTLTSSAYTRRLLEERPEVHETPIER